MALFASALMVIPGAARAAVVRTVCSQGCDFGSITEAVTQSNPDDLIFSAVSSGRSSAPKTLRFRIVAR
jgi:hypothetical protein